MKFWLAIVLVLFCGDAFGDSLKGGHVGCLSEESYTEIIKAAARKDEVGFRMYLDKDCTITKAGIQIIVQDVQLLNGRARVLAYVGDWEFDMWTSLENIQRER